MHNQSSPPRSVSILSPSVARLGCPSDVHSPRHCDICREMNIEIIDLAVNIDHVHLFFKYHPKYSASYIAQQIKGVVSKRLRERFPHLKRWCKKSLWAPSCFHGSVGHGQQVVEKYIKAQKNFNYERAKTKNSFRLRRSCIGYM